MAVVAIAHSVDVTRARFEDPCRAHGRLPQRTVARNIRAGHLPPRPSMTVIVRDYHGGVATSPSAGCGEL